MTDPDEQGESEATAFLRDLIDRYGVKGLTDRLAAAIEEAEAGRVEGPALNEATAWLEQEEGAHIAAFGTARLNLFAAGAASAAAGTAHLALNAGAVVHGRATGEVAGATDSVAAVVTHARAAFDVAGATDSAAVSVTEAAHLVVSALPTNMQVIAQVEQTFWYLVNLWSLTQVPTEVIPVALLLALAIVVTRIRIKQANGG